jgi:hypothetical protein
MTAASTTTGKLPLANSVILGFEFRGTRNHILLSHDSESRITSPPNYRLSSKLLVALVCTVVLGSEFSSDHDYISLSHSSLGVVTLD